MMESMMAAWRSRRGWRDAEGWPIVVTTWLGTELEKQGKRHVEQTLGAIQLLLQLCKSVSRLRVGASPGAGDPDTVDNVVDDNTSHKARLGVLVAKVHVHVRVCFL